MFIMAFIFLLFMTINCCAVTEAEVQSAVESSSKESVSGNLFVWFLCAVAFMKVSQKIDSFMSSLGISVGRTGGSMISEAMIVGKTIGSAFKSGGKFAGFGKQGSAVNGGNAPAGAGGIFGGIGRKMSEGAAGAVTGNENSSGGIMQSFGKKLYQNSVGKGGSFATSVISSVARGEINKMGTISGANGKAAMESYFGYNASASIDKKGGNSSSLNIEHGGATTLKNENSVNGVVGHDIKGHNFGENIPFNENPSGIGSGYAENVAPNEISYPEAGQNFGENSPFYDNTSGMGTSFADEVNSNGYTYHENGYSNNFDMGNSMPVFSDIEMGGGRITGVETTAEHPDGIQFAMYDADKYSKPEGKYEVVTAIDNSKWYKQYAAPTVEKTPFMDPKGKVQYNEKIVQKIPQAPIRKDKM